LAFFASIDFERAIGIAVPEGSAAGPLFSADGEGGAVDDEADVCESAEVARKRLASSRKRIFWRLIEAPP
jgi:hypothetical protein